MKISRKRPSIYEACERKFGVRWKKGVIFTYGDTIRLLRI